MARFFDTVGTVPTVSFPSHGATPGSLAGGGRSRAEPLRHRAGASGRGGPAVDLGARRAGFR